MMKIEKGKCRNAVSRMTFRLPQDENWIGLKFYMFYISILLYVFPHSIDFLRMIKQIGNLPENSILITADVVGFSPSIRHKLDLKALEEGLEKRKSKQMLWGEWHSV